tara:strand:+ start:178 stop:831 length:654 start_codon:yes stop_codon:yes gene_type:complete
MVAAFFSKKIVWLRSLTVMANIVVLPYFFFFLEEPLWNNIVWVGVYTTINLIMLFLIFLESRPVKLSDMEQKIYDRTFKSLSQKEFKNLIDHGSINQHQPKEGLITRDTHLEKLMLVVEGQAEVVLKNGDEVDITAGGFIGEQSFITGENTSADVATGRGAATILSWHSDSLRKYLEKKPHLKETLELILTSDVIHKLRDMEEMYDEIKHSNDLSVK